MPTKTVKTPKNAITDLSRVLKPFPGKWVALSDDQKVVGVGSSLKNAWEEAKKHGVADPIITKAPKNNGTYIL